MRHVPTDTHLRLALIAFQDADGYVDSLLGLARDQIMARQLLIAAKESRTRGDSASRNSLAEYRGNLH
jgi:hypothetical protein